VIFNNSGNNDEDNKNCNIFEMQPVNPTRGEKRLLIFLFLEPVGFPAACNFRK
jgi:hypothetical protein